MEVYPTVSLPIGNVGFGLNRSGLSNSGLALTAALLVPYSVGDSKVVERLAIDFRWGLILHKVSFVISLAAIEDAVTETYCDGPLCEKKEQLAHGSIGSRPRAPVYDSA